MPLIADSNLWPLTSTVTISLNWKCRGILSSLRADDGLLTFSPSSKYQLRLFCTSSIFYSGPNSFRATTGACPIEFPPTCEVRVNNVQLTANLKGLKKKPGTAPPPDLGKYVRLTNVQNRVEMVYVNSQQPPQSKVSYFLSINLYCWYAGLQPQKYYLVVMLVEVTTVDTLVSDLKVSSYRSSKDIKKKS